MRRPLFISAGLIVLAMAPLFVGLEVAGCRKSSDTGDGYSPPPEPTVEQLAAAAKEYENQLGYVEDNPPNLNSLRSDFCRRVGNPRLPCFYSRSPEEDVLKGLSDLPFGFGLEISGRVTDVGIKHLAALKNLTLLCVSNYGGTGAGLKGFGKLTVLELGITPVWPTVVGGELQVTGGTTPTDLRELAELEHLTALNLAVFQNAHLVRHEALVRNIGQLKKIKALGLGITLGHDDQMQLAKQLVKLEQIEYLAVNLTDERLIDVARLQKLTAVNLCHSPVSDRGLRHLAALQSLTSLNLAGTRVTDAGLKDVAAHQGLAVLDLSGLPITDTGLKDLALLPRLATLYLRGTNVTAEGLAEFHKLLPGCIIIRQ